MAKCDLCRRSFRGSFDSHIEWYHPEYFGSNSANKRRVLIHQKRDGQKIVVDGANVAYFADGKPKVRNLRFCRGSLITGGFNPIIIISQALMHTIDEPGELHRFLNIGWVQLAENDRDDDIAILECAIGNGCDIVSNDNFSEHRKFYQEKFSYIKIRKFSFQGSLFVLV